MPQNPVVDGRADPLAEVLIEALAPSSTSAGTVLSELLRAARLHLGMAIGFISRFEEGHRVFLYVDAQEDSRLVQAGAREPLEDTYCARVADGRLPEVLHDAREHPEARALPATERAGVRAHISVPIRRADGEIYGTFCCFGPRPDTSLSKRDVALLKTFAHVAAKFLEHDHAQRVRERSARERIEAVLRERRLEMVWQPIVHLADGTIVGVEALARFPGPPKRTPDVWFNEAASVGMAAELEHVAASKGLELLDDAPPGPYVACNFSAAAILHGDLDATLRGRSLDRVVLEITEHDVITDYAALRDALAPFRARGLRLAIDDVGAGYASMRHILRLEPELIKLDLSLVRDIDTDVARQALVAAFVSFAKTTGAQLVAEGVETAAELEALRALDVDRAQGYHLYKPSAAIDLPWPGQGSFVLDVSDRAPDR
jgi:EAL domain-containing protein (putative c-di-GMP-specific phosphodiesterase class I)